MAAMQIWQEIQRVQNDILERIARGDPLPVVMDRMCRMAESIARDAICSLIGIDEERRLRPIAAPSMPSSVAAALDGQPIGAAVGSCGTSAHLGKAVIVTDIDSDPLWDDYRSLVQPLGLKACWSSPINARDGRVIGTFALYFRTCRGPSEIEASLVGALGHLAAIAIEQEEIRQRNHRLAHCDGLTDLPNRLSFKLAVDERIGKRDFALLLVDLDRFKSVNDTMGHAVGDALLREIADRLRHLPFAASTFRLGGDEFAMIIDKCSELGALESAADQLVVQLTKPFHHDNLLINPDVSIGGVIAQRHGFDAATLFQNADFALYHAKERPGGSFVAFTAGMRTRISNRLTMIAELADALTEQRIEAHYQPIVKIQTGEIIGLEALARLRARDGRLISAGEFHEALTDPRLAGALTGHMLRQVAADVRRWIDGGIAFQHVGVNFSSSDFESGDMEEKIAAAFGAENVPLKHLILEVTETVLIRPDGRVAEAVSNLRAGGMRVALDDFGTGYASLTHLLDFPVDILKIDKSFVDRLLRDKRSLVIVRGLVAMAHELGIRVVAEGIENSEQAMRLSELGCRLGQGYLYARPADAATTERLLRLFAQPAESEPEVDRPSQGPNARRA